MTNALSHAAAVSSLACGAEMLLPSVPGKSKSLAADEWEDGLVVNAAPVYFTPPTPN